MNSDDSVFVTGRTDHFPEKYSLTIHFCCMNGLIILLRDIIYGKYQFTGSKSYNLKFYKKMENIQPCFPY